MVMTIPSYVEGRRHDRSCTVHRNHHRVPAHRPKPRTQAGRRKVLGGHIDRTELESIAATLRRDTCESLVAAGLDSVPVNTFSYYDQVLDTALLVGALPARVADIADDLDRYFAAARGNDEVAPLEMTKWLDTNYHYLVPEIGINTRFSLNPAKVLGELEQARAQGIPARPVVIGPVTFLALSKAVDGAGAPVGRLEELVGVYTELLELLAAHGITTPPLSVVGIRFALSPNTIALRVGVRVSLP